MNTKTATPFLEKIAAHKSWVVSLLPGLLVAGTIAMAPRHLSDHYNGPAMLFALLLGMAFHFLSEKGHCVRGIEFATKKILRVGVALLGLRITIDQISDLGVVPVLLIAGCVILTLCSGLVFAKMFRRSPHFGLINGRFRVHLRCIGGLSGFFGLAT